MKRELTTLNKLNEGDLFYFCSDTKKIIYRRGAQAKARTFDKYIWKMFFFDFKNEKGEWHLSRKSPKQGNVNVVKFEK